MAEIISLAALAGDREIATTRIFDAPRELVWKVWTDPQQQFSVHELISV